MICDFAEVYHVYDYKQLPVDTVAAFFVGLRNDSRIKLAMAGEKYGHRPVEILLAMAVDALNNLVWMQTENGRKGENRPESVALTLLGIEPKDSASQYETFATGSDFERRRKELLERNNNGS